MRGGQFMTQPTLFQQITSFFTNNWCYIVAGLAILFAVLYFIKPTQVIAPVKEKMCNSCPKRERQGVFSM